MAVINNPKIIYYSKRFLLAAAVVNQNKGGGGTRSASARKIWPWRTVATVEITCVIITLPFT